MEHYSEFKFTHDGRAFTARLYVDDDHSPPWKDYDGTGKVRCVHAPYGLRGSGIKKPGERVIHWDGYSGYLYDWAGACETARRDGWNAPPYDAPNRIERAVQADFDRLRGWLTRDWWYVGVAVTLDHPEDEQHEFEHALWGIESDAGDYLHEVAHELARQVAPRYVHTMKEFA
jgi:hypothetical protein